MSMKIGSRHTPETIEKMRRAQQLRHLRRPQAVALKEGDMVVCPDGAVGLLSILKVTGPSSIQIAQNVWRRHSWKVLRRATMAEIIDAGLHGVGCNQAYDP